MFVKNATNVNQQFRAAGHKFMLRPGETVAMTKEEVNDHTVQFLLARGVLVVLGEDEGMGNIVAQVEEDQARKSENKLEVNKAGEDTTKQVILVQCAAKKKNGERCMNNVSVPVAEYKESLPYFCGTHKNEDASLYRLVDGAWVVDSPEPEPIAEPVADDPIGLSDEDIAAALSEPANGGIDL